MLHRQDPPPEPHIACPPAKKRKESLRIQEDVISYSLPAKKRVLAPNPSLSLDFDLRIQEDVISYSLPAKKRVLAPNPSLSSPKKPKLSKIPDEEPGIGEEEGDDDGVICAICSSTDGNPEDPIVFCDGCDLMVHASCYGNPLTSAIPEGDWFCLRCENKKENTDCCLCVSKAGPTKPTTDGRWAHVLCALLVPEAFFNDPDGREGLDLSRVLERRWMGKCCVCEASSEGCVIDCSEDRCGLAFHASCAVGAELCVEYREGRAGGIVVGFCPEHTLLWKKVSLSLSLDLSLAESSDFVRCFRFHGSNKRRGSSNSCLSMSV